MPQPTATPSPNICHGEELAAEAHVCCVTSCSSMPFNSLVCRALAGKRLHLLSTPFPAQHPSIVCLVCKTHVAQLLLPTNHHRTNLPPPPKLNGSLESELAVAAGAAPVSPAPVLAAPCPKSLSAEPVMPVVVSLLFCPVGWISFMGMLGRDVM